MASRAGFQMHVPNDSRGGQSKQQRRPAGGKGQWQGQQKGSGKGDRGHKVGGGSANNFKGTSAAEPKEGPADAPEADRTAIFQKTKMCRFHILGLCTKGTDCRFAHDRNQLNGVPDLFRTKLCKTLINTGSCEDPDCRYAHTKLELRCTPVEPCGPMNASDMPSDMLTTALPRGPIQRDAAGGAMPGAVNMNADGMVQVPMMIGNQAAMMQMLQAANIQAQHARQLQAMVMAMQAQANGQAAAVPNWQQTQQPQSQQQTSQAPPTQQLPQMNGVFPGFPQVVAWDPNTVQQMMAGGLPAPVGSSAPSGVAAFPVQSMARMPQMSGSPFGPTELQQKAAVAAATSSASSTRQNQEHHSSQASEPAQINPGLLRSIKSNGSICDLDAPSENDSGCGVKTWDYGRSEASNSNLTVRNTFLDVKDESPSNTRLVHSMPGLNSLVDNDSPVNAESEQPFAGGVRRIGSGTRLVTLAEEMSLDAGADGQSSGRPLMPRPSSSGQLLPQLPENRIYGQQGSSTSQASGSRCHQLSDSEKRLQDTPITVGSEPALICPGSLRSVRSGPALASMAEEQEASGHAALKSVGSGLALAAMAPPDESAPPALRSVGSGLALAAMAAAAEAAAEASSLRSVGSGAALAAMAGDVKPLGRVGSGLALASMSTQDVYVRQISSDELDDEDDHHAASGLQSQVHLSGMPNDSGFKLGVKNTFLDFQAPRERTGLRSVQTFGGRLDLMG